MRVHLIVDITGDFDEDNMTQEEKEDIVHIVLDDGSESSCLYCQVEEMRIE